MWEPTTRRPKSRVSPRRWRKYPNKRPYCRDQDSSPMGPACVKSRIGRKSVQSFSLLSSRDGSCLHCSISNRQNRDGSSKSKLNFDFSHSLGQQLPPALQKWSGKLLAIRYARKRRPCAGMLNYLRRSRIGYRHWFSQKRVVFRPLRRKLICRRQRLRPPYAVPGHAKGRQGLRSHATGTAWRTAALRVKWRRDSLLQPRRHPRS